MVNFLKNITSIIFNDIQYLDSPSRLLKRVTSHVGLSSLAGELEFMHFVLADQSVLHRSRGYHFSRVIPFPKFTSTATLLVS